MPRPPATFLTTRGWSERVPEPREGPNGPTQTGLPVRESRAAPGAGLLYEESRRSSRDPA